MQEKMRQVTITDDDVDSPLGAGTENYD